MCHSLTTGCVIRSPLEVSFAHHWRCHSLTNGGAIRSPLEVPFAHQWRNGLFKCLRTSIRNTRYISRICYRKKPVVLKRKKSDSHRTPSSFASLKSGTLEHDTRDKVKDPSVKQTDDVTL
ncbi:hypothetical protein Btru_077948 [Bulinus truncatus]|nr:hypothetical protein Btru_077948 [Bulinus truncatus]